MAKKSEKPQMKYEQVPVVPKDFDGAAKTNIEALKAIDYWKEQKGLTWRDDQKQFAQAKIKAWQQVKLQAEATMQSYQLRLF